MARKVLIVAMALFFAPLSQQLAAQGYPSKPLRMVIAFPPGGSTDIVGRIVAQKMGERLGQQVTVENRGGAGGSIGTEAVAKAAPDGYTITLATTSTHVVAPAAYPKLGYDPIRDFAAVSLVAVTPYLLVVHPSLDVKTVKEFVAFVKARPGKFNYASAGTGSATHINAEKFRVAAGITATHVPFKGTPEALTETIGGRIDWFFAPIVSALPLIKDGKLQVLAVGTPKRSDDLPQVPTTTEAGVAGSEYTFWVGMLAPAKTPKPVVDRLNAEVVKILNSKEFKTRLDAIGASPMPMSTAAFGGFIKSETESIAKLVQTAGIKAN